MQPSCTLSSFQVDPWGTFFCGPEVSVSLQVGGAVKCDFGTLVVPAAINNTLHQDTDAAWIGNSK
jgi:hypothetical protein